jgi:hypothetical protein
VVHISVACMYTWSSTSSVKACNTIVASHNGTFPVGRDCQSQTRKHGDLTYTSLAPSSANNYWHRQ